MHIPVLQKEVIHYLAPQPDQNFVDATFGEGGHSLAILERNKPNGKVLAIEFDPELCKKVSVGVSAAGRLILVNDSYVNLGKIVEKYNFKPISGILFDLGLSSWHLEKSGRGFSFRKKDEILDMRYNPEKSSLTAWDILNQWNKKEIEKILKEYGEERFAKRIAENITELRLKRPIRTTSDLVRIIDKAVPAFYLRSATRTFQALRIAVNNELNNLKLTLPQSLEMLNQGGRIVVISFHSLEDRIVKNFFRENKKRDYLKILTKKPITPTKKELQGNPKARSAKLRAAIKI